MTPDKRVRAGLVVVTLALLALSVVMIYSASAIFADQRYGDSMFFLKRHVLFMMIGFAGALVAMCVDYDRLRLWAFALFIFTCIALLVVGLFGPKIGGARRWIELGLFLLKILGP